MLNIPSKNCDLNLVGFSGWGHSFGWLGKVEGFREVFLLEKIFENELPLVEQIDSELAEAEGRLLLLGWSLGGMIALSYAARRSSRIAGIVCLASCARFVGSDTSLYASSSQELRAFKKRFLQNPRELASQFIKSVHGNCAGGEEHEDLIRDFLAQPRSRMVNQLDFLLSCSLLDEISAIDVPILVIHGNRDTIIPSGSSLAIAERMEKSELVVYPSFGHDIVYNAPSEMELSIVDFVAGL